MDSGLRYEDAGSCYAEAQNTGMEMREIGMSPPNFTCVPVAKVKTCYTCRSTLFVSIQLGFSQPIFKLGKGNWLLTH